MAHVVEPHPSGPNYLAWYSTKAMHETPAGTKLYAMLKPTPQAAEASDDLLCRLARKHRMFGRMLTSIDTGNFARAVLAAFPATLKADAAKGST